MQTHVKQAVTSLAVPLLLCVGCPPPVAVPPSTGTLEMMPGASTVDEETLTPTTGMSPGGTDTPETTGMTEPAETSAMTGVPDDTGDTEGPREPIANSVLATFVDEQGNPLPGAWVRVLSTPVLPPSGETGDPTSDPPEDPPEKPVPGARSKEDLPLPITADSGGHVLVEALGAGEQRWMMGAPGFVTRTEVFTLPSGTRTHNTFRLKHKGQTFKFDTQVAQSFDHENVHVELPAGHMINRRTGEQVTGEISVNITVVNPVAGSLDAAPVPLIGVDIEGGSGSLASFGMVGVDLIDSEGERLELNEEVAAKVSFKLTKEQSEQVDLLGAKIIPAWHADPDSGETEWTEIGVFFIGEKDDEGRYTVMTHMVRRFSWVNTDLKSTEPRCYIIQAVDQFDNPINTPLNVGPYFNVANDGSVCIDFAAGSPDFSYGIPGKPQMMQAVDVNHPKSVCKENNRLWYVDYPHGDCTPIKIVVDNSPKCVPGSTWDCSNEPGMNSDPTQDGIGICKSATKLCADGTAWGACQPPVLPKPEMCSCPPPDPNAPPCDPELGIDDDCDGEVNEKENGNDCACTFGQTADCYVGNPDDLAPEFTCAKGLQKCTIFGEYGQCMSDNDGIVPDATMVTPSLANEDCDPSNLIESCDPNPCDFDPIWWHTFGKTGKHVNLANHLNGNFMTSITLVTNDGETAVHGSCFDGIANPLNKDPFNGVTLAKYEVDGPDPDFQYCEDANIIEGKLNTVAIRADSGATGTAVSGLTAGVVLPNLNDGENGCDKGINAGASFVTRFSSKNVCQYRVVASGAINIKDVGVGNTTASTIIGLTLPANQPNLALTVAGMPLAGCTFAQAPTPRAVYVKLGLGMDAKVVCTSKEFGTETPLALDVDSTGVTSIVYREADTYRLRQLDGTLAPKWPTDPEDVTKTSIAGVLTVPGSDFEPTDIASFGSKIAVVGNFIGEMTSYGDALKAIKGNRDFVLLVADNGQPMRGEVLLGRAPVGKPDYGDFGTAVRWVTYFDPDTYDQSDALVVAGNTYSPDFAFGPCWTDVNPLNDTMAVDGFVGVFKYTSGLPFTLEKSCGDHHVLTGLGDQAINSLTVSDMRLGLCGYHNKNINIGGKIVETFKGDEKNAHCGYTVLPIKNMQ